jgi:hypothetical protein
MPRPGDRWIASSLALLAMTAEVSRFNCQTACGCESAFPRRGSRPSCALLPRSNNGGRREDRVHAAPAVSCALRTESRAHEHTGSAETLRPSLRSGFTAYNVISPANGSFCHRRRARREPLRSLTPAPRRQNHTTSPYASRALVLRTLRVHRISPRVRDVRTPLVRVRRAELNH